MLRKAPALLILVLLISLLVSLACDSDNNNEKASNETSAPAITPIKLIPQKASLLADIDLERILEDEDIAGLYNSMSKEDTSIPETYDELAEIFGGNSAEGVLFADISSISQADEDSEEAGNPGYLGIIVNGIKDKERVMSLIESTADEPLKVISYKEFEIHTDAAQEMGLCFVGDDGLVLGSMQAVKDVLAIEKGEQPALTGKLVEQLDDLENALVRLVIAVPQDALEEGLQGLQSEMPIDLSKLADLETIALSIDKDDQSLPITVSLCFANTDSAKSIMDSLNDVSEQFLGGDLAEMPENTQALISALKDMKVTRDASCINISVDLPISVIEDLAQSFDFDGG